jgi:hypothetical protein
MKTVVVLGLLGQIPMAGIGWQVLHHMIGFRRLGCRCFYVENSAAPPYSPRLRALATSARDNIRFVHRVLARHGFGGAWSYFDCLANTWAGMGEARSLALVRDADMVVNLCGASLPETARDRRGCLVYLETDPVLEQFRLASGDARARAFVAGHDVHFTYGWNVGSPECPVPDAGIPWKKTHPPVLCDLWNAPPHPRARWRTIASYHNKGKDLHHGGRTYLWSKKPNFDRVLELPKLVREKLEVALDADAGVAQRFLDRGWFIRDPVNVSDRLGRYRGYIQGAKGEFSVEKEQVVDLAPGWFSDRSVCFLASGRPCVIQDTGFGSRIPAGPGLIAWRTLDEAKDALEAVARDYPAHARAASRIARDYFDARVLLPPILAAAGL